MQEENQLSYWWVDKDINKKESVISELKEQARK